MTTQYAFHLDANICTGCKACQIACKDKNNLPPGISWRHVAEYTAGSWMHNDGTYEQNVSAYYTSIACNHCADPACLKACPTGAISKRDDGIVVIDQSKCVGCRYCVWACPYGAPQFDSAIGKVSKCNFCADYIDQGANPACVDACPSRALTFGDAEELRAQFGTLASVEPLPDASITQPSLVITPHRAAQHSGTGTGVLANPEEM